MKQQRVPKLFRTPVSPKKLEKNILRRIHIESEKQFLLEKLEQDEQGRYRIPAETAGSLEKNDLKRLKSIAKAVKKNKGLLTAWKAGTIAVIVVAVVGFNLFFKNRIVERAAENGLQKVFNAAVDIEGTGFSIFRGTVGFDHMTIADEDRPMRNLVELGRTNLSLDTGRALSGKIIINEIVCREIRFATPRAVSGALPGADPLESGRDKAGEKLGELAGEAQTLGIQIGRESAERMVRRYRDGLETPALMESVQKRYAEMSARWNARAEKSNALAEDLEKRTEELLSTDVASIDTPQEAEAYLSKLNQLKNSIDTARTHMEETYQEFERDLDYIRTSSAEIAAAIEADIAFLQDAVGTFGADAAGMLAASAEPLVRTRLGRFYSYGEKIVRIYSRISGSSGRSRGRFSEKGRQGTTIVFPSTGYPSFLIKEFEVSAGAEGMEGFSRVVIHDLTGDQETWGKPTTAGFSTLSVFGMEGTGLLTGLTIDSRSGAEYLLDSTTVIEGFPLDVSGGIPPLSIQSIQAETENTFELLLKSDFSGKGNLTADLSNLSIDFSEEDTVVGGAVRSILSDIDTVTLDASFGFTGGLIDDLAIATNIDSLLSERVGSYLKEQADKAAAEIEAAFRDYIADELETNETLRGGITAGGRELLADIRSLEDLERTIEKEKEALKARARQEIGTQTRDQLEDLGGLKLPGF